MRKLFTSLIPAVICAVLFSTDLAAQQTRVLVKVEKDGKVVKDTSYNFEDADQTEQALLMMDMMGAEGEHDHCKKVVVVKSGDGESYDILMNEDGEARDEDANVEVIVIKEKEIKKKSKKQ